MNKDVISSAVLGSAVGDALGVPYEYETREYMENHQISGMSAYGTHNQPAGTWSDDTSMTLALLDSLSSGRLDLEDIAGRFVSWYRNGEYTPHGIVFDIGISTEKSVIMLENGSDPYSSGASSQFDNGNGSLMYIMPLALFLYNEENSEKRMRDVFSVSGITHNHIRSKISCFFYNELIIAAVKYRDIEKSYASACSSINNSGIFDIYPEEYDNFETLLRGNIKDLQINDIRSSGYVINTLEAALWCVFNSESYSDAVLSAVMLGEDTDTTASVTGALAGIIFGYDSIPRKWISSLANFELIKSIIKKFSNMKTVM
ncbi:MAG: ADP-ribosylglycohydrolase family protein [Oscillospiraceae bacterium]|nr:ADP-ribosylglycohydrolase family protein [Oscillospiraceae bacterium]